MARRDQIIQQAATLLEISNLLKEEFNTFRGAVQFFQHKNRPDLFIFQIRQAHVADVGRVLMQISYLVKMEYALFDGMTMRESRNIPEEGHSGELQYLNALKHVFINIRLDPWLQHHIFSQTTEGTTPFLDVVRLPYLLEDFVQHLPKKIPSPAAILPHLSALVE